jgi:salicylate hydroxylase
VTLHLAKRPLKVIIIGAGIGGLAAAVALRQRGLEVELFERSAKLEEVGAGLQIGPNGVKVLRALGLEAELMRNTFEPFGIMSVTWDEGRLRFRQPLKDVAREKYGAPYLTAHRADLHNLLRRAAGDAPLHLGANCIGAETVNRTAAARFADGSTAEADIIIGCDGIRSAVRAQHFGEGHPRFTEMMAWRAMVPMDCVPTRIGPGGTVAVPHGEYFGWIGPNGHVICYPIGVKGDRLNIFGGHVTTEWVEESWSVPSSREELIAAKAGWNEALLDMFRHVEHVYKWGIYDRDPLPHWTSGRVTLLGDAAHPTMPTLAQGANMAIEDGYVLAHLLAQHADDPETALNAYPAQRKPRTDWVTLKSREQFANNRKASPPPFVDRTWLFVNDVVRGSVALQPA